MQNTAYTSTPARGDVGTPDPKRLEMDNLIRRELGVGDPSNPQQVANALRERYQNDARTRAIEQEAQGLPFLQTRPLFVPAAMERTATAIDLEQARSDVDKDLQELTSSNLLKDVAPELDGWADSIRAAVTEATSAARFGLDPRQRDRAFGLRRTLSDYARLARLVGALTPSMNHNYRSLAQSIDEVNSVILVLVGESMANNGFAGGRFLLQAPYTELQTRRDAAMHALRNLLGSLQFTNQANEWPRGIDAYRRLFDALELQGQGDLRALMTEQELGRTMDALVRRAAQGTATGLRALGSTAQVDLQRFYRLINFGYQLVNPESPPLTSFLEALRLFADGFGTAGGFRLLRVARPPIVFYGLYTQEEEEHADRRLTQLTIERGRLASQLDCLMRCNCDETTARAQIMLDKALYDVDRAIDLYAVGRDDLGQPELRAAAYSYLLEALLRSTTAAGRVVIPVLPTDPPLQAGDPAQANDPCTSATAVPRPELRRTLINLSNLLRPKDATPQLSDWDTTVINFEDRRKKNKKLPGSDFRFADVLHQELCLQLDGEQRWEHMVRQMAPNCISASAVFGPTGDMTLLLKNAMALAAFGAKNVETDCGLQGPNIPAHIETSMDTIAYNSSRTGRGR
jgi:hypothetical protein